MIKFSKFIMKYHVQKIVIVVIVSFGFEEMEHKARKGINGF